jgi:hypothetical protein
VPVYANGSHTDRTRTFASVGNQVLEVCRARSAEAAAINDRGDILGYGETVGGESQYFLLTPNPNGELTPKALITAPPAGAR